MKFLGLVLFILPMVARAAITPEEQEFFERRIRPVLAQDCYECHNSTGKRKAGLALDSRAAWQEGGDSGPAIVPGDVKESLLLRSIRHEDKELKMPRNGAKLEEQVVHDFEHWVEMGAPDPRDRPATPEQVAQDKDWNSVLARRKRWWSFQPISHPAVPPGEGWSDHPIDCFLQATRKAGGLEPSGEAEARVLLRRLSYVLTGLPPTPEELEVFVQAAQSHRQQAVEAATDRLLASPRFGECWARHWMDWVRYAETHGSEGDPAIPYAWRYRDYLIRALNADVSFPQLVREHLAGDLLERPRIDAERGINESAIGAAHFRMVLHGYSPTDAQDEQATFTDNQIDTVTKTFLGLTVACARCHDHKFDAISQTDYYALFGIFASCRPATVDINLPARQQAGLVETVAAREEVKRVMARAWLAKENEIADRLRRWTPGGEKEKAGWLGEDAGPMAAWLHLKDLPREKWENEWARLREKARLAQSRLEAFHAQPTLARWDLRGPEAKEWEASGAGIADGPAAAGAFAVGTEGDQIITGIYPAGVYSHLRSDRQGGILASPLMMDEGGKIWVRLRGSGEARARYVVRNYPRTGTVYPRLELTNGQDQWVNWNIDYWKGDTLHVEITTEADQPVETKGKEHSWFGVTEVAYVADANAPPPPAATASLLAFPASEGRAPQSIEELASRYTSALRGCIEHWQAGKMSDLEAEFLGSGLRAGLLPNRLPEVAEASAAVAAFHRAEAGIPSPTRAPGLLEGYAFDQPLFTRGDHKHPAAAVPRRFLEAIDARPYAVGGEQSGRRQLAESILSPQNPLTARVIVNRLWLHVFGQGLVSTPDNFGRLGEAPSQPQLLDYLASEFQAKGGSIKGFLRALVTSRSFQLEAGVSSAAAERDPENRFFTHFPAHRFEAEAIRDTMLALTGKAANEVGGEPTEGRNYRRSVYAPVQRNRIDLLLAVFDFPVPVSTRGKRDATNVPAQALALLNNPGVAQWAGDWARRIAADASLRDDEARVTRMYLESFGRAPRPAELRDCLEFVGAPPADWRGLAQALFNAKEFIYLR